MTISGIAKRVPSAEAARSMITLAATTMTSDPAATITSGHRPGTGRIADPSSASSSVTAARSQVIHRRGSRRRSRPRPGTPRATTYSATTTSPSRQPAAGGRRPSTTATHTPATPVATVPPSTTTLRCSPMPPATTAPRPSRAARLKTFEPRMTPAPSRRSPLAIALTAAVTSGASAAIAAAMPSNASDRPRRSPTRSSRETSSQLVIRHTTAPAINAATAGPAVMPAGPRIVAERAARRAQRWRRLGLQGELCTAAAGAACPGWGRA